MPAYPQVSVFVGAGHAYKWASLIGLILAQIAVNGQTTYPIDAFRITRYATLSSGNVSNKVSSRAINRQACPPERQDSQAVRRRTTIFSPRAVGREACAPTSASSLGARALAATSLSWQISFINPTTTWLLQHSFTCSSGPHHPEHCWLDHVPHSPATHSPAQGELSPNYILFFCF